MNNRDKTINREPILPGQNRKAQVKLFSKLANGLQAVAIQHYGANESRALERAVTLLLEHHQHNLADPLNSPASRRTTGHASKIIRNIFRRKAGQKRKARKCHSSTAKRHRKSSKAG
jgi:hypothetical protein